MSVALSFDGVVKRYGRKGARALDGMTFAVPTGVLAGFVGPNGAGKTTTFSVVSGFLPPDEGTVDILGAGPFDPWRFKGRLGVLPQDAELPDRHTPVELLTHLGRLQGMAPARARQEAEARVHQVRLGERAGHRIGTLSHGMRRRVAVASALLGEPELVLLDEPMSGLDPVQARSLRDVLRGLAGRQTVVVSSHNLLELERLCDWVVMVDRGRCVRQGSVAEVTGRGERLLWQVSSDGFDVDALRARLPRCTLTLTGHDLEVEAASGEDLDRVSVTVMEALVHAGVGLRALQRGVSLEDRFLGDAQSGEG